MPAHIKLNKYLGFGRFRYMTGAQVLQTQDGVSYLRWAHHAGMVIDGEILFQIGLHPSQTNPEKKPELIPITPELIAEAQAHEDQLNGATPHEETIRTSKECTKLCPHCSNTGGLSNHGEPASGSSADIWLLYC